MMESFTTYFLSGGLFSVIIGLFTLNSKIKKAAAETATLELANSEKATDILINNIVEPLKLELHETRKEFNETKREMERLRIAIDRANTCRYIDICPVLLSLQHPGADGGAQGENGNDANGVRTKPPSCPC